MSAIPEYSSSSMDEDPAPDEAVLDQVAQKVLWLATSMVHHANRVRANPSGIKVGGHQASSASMVSLMTALWFDGLTAEDRVSVKPHASPVLHAINYLLGRLDVSYLSRLREYGGLQPYPSRTKDPDHPDYSTGSVGIGATAPVWGAIARRYLSARLGTEAGGRQISLLGDAELDEGAIWECVADPMVAHLGEVLWVVDLNRQSLDRVVPDIAIGRWSGMFAAAGWDVVEVKYGRQLHRMFTRAGGQALRRRIDEMSNEEYQWLLRTPAQDLRERLIGGGPDARALRRVLRDSDDAELAALIRDLGGHDMAELSRAFATADPSRPTVVFAYTIKGWNLPIEGHPGNHSALLSDGQYRQLAERIGGDPQDPWRPFEAGSAAGRLCAQVADRLRRGEPLRSEPPAMPTELGRRYRGRQSTQATLGRVLGDLARDAPDVAARVVTVSPDVASSTNAGGWINRVGVWSPRERHDWFAEDGDRLIRWRESPRSQHIELGIAEVNLMGLLGELGATWLTVGEPLLPIGTIYDPFVGRALEPWSFGTYAGGRSILVGTPSGVTLAAEGGAHQSVVTPTVGLQQPGVTTYEPAFAVEAEWCLLHALSRLGRADGESAYLRLTTRPIDQELAAVPADAFGRERRRRAVLNGGYRLRAVPGVPDVTLAAAGALVPEAIEAAERLEEAGVACDVVVVTSYDLLWRAMSAGPSGDGTWIVEEVFPASRRSPLVTVLDGHPHTLAFLGAFTGSPVSCLGVSSFGQGGSLEDVYRSHRIDAPSIEEAALSLLRRTS
ncbi:pyruvate dehydrogenase [Nonomuraea sp. MCN248]|uniref:Pyruvate dehydrogenase E1 component n=1 Tax=Nonomuraea corallina TaxID=2989783 RepID=A0ABT4S9Y2_9ACTN|nr:pyruvate dehydrogenase [Nonomuraea corallina]MDA0634021.1 pyruvate dehydrogenase [Nonomuraea corallina]